MKMIFESEALFTVSSLLLIITCGSVVLEQHNYYIYIYYDMIYSNFS